MSIANAKLLQVTGFIKVAELSKQIQQRWNEQRKWIRQLKEVDDGSANKKMES